MRCLVGKYFKRTRWNFTGEELYRYLWKSANFRKKDISKEYYCGV